MKYKKHVGYMVGAISGLTVMIFAIILMNAYVDRQIVKKAQTLGLPERGQIVIYNKKGDDCDHKIVFKAGLSGDEDDRNGWLTLHTATSTISIPLHMVDSYSEPKFAKLRARIKELEAQREFLLDKKTSKEGGQQ